MEREVRYCTTEDGVRFAYGAEGQGPPLVICHGAIESISLDPLFGTPQHFFRRLQRGRRLIRFDMRGTGLSQRDVADLSHAGFPVGLELGLRFHPRLELAGGSVRPPYRPSPPPYFQVPSRSWSCPP